MVKLTANGKVNSRLAAPRDRRRRRPRPARRHEAAALQALALAALDPYGPRFGAPPPPLGVDLARLVGQRAVYVVDDEAGEPGAAAGPAALMAVRRGERVLAVPLLAIRPDRRGSGLVGLLVAHAETLARLAGLARVELTVEDALWERKARYARLGYQEVELAEHDGVVRAVFRKDIG